MPATPSAGPEEQRVTMGIERNEKIAVIGAGLMGTGIAHAFAAAGFQTVVADTSAEARDRARAAIDAIFADGIRLGKIADTDARDARARLSFVEQAAHAAAGADLCVETASEQLPIKLKIVEDIGAVMAPDGIIATNSSALSVTRIATAAPDPARVIGMHFFNPVHKMKLVELVLGIGTSSDTLERMRRYSAALGKESIVVNEAPGLTTSRMSALAGNEAMYMLMEGTATAEDIDTAMRMGFNHPMGPLELGDLTGWDTRLSVLEYLHRTLGEKFRPCPLIVKMVASGRIGRKAGHGVYRYEDGKKVPGSGLRAHLL